MNENMNEEPGNELPFGFKKQQTTTAQQHENWNRIADRIHAGKPSHFLFRKIAVFATVLVIIVSGIFWLFVTKSRPAGVIVLNEIKTGFGDRKSIVLPDSSVVVLNANSTLKIPATWSSQDNRDVWLEGEAYFEITKKPGAGNAHFIVHTQKVNVRVLGTKFNVNTYNNQSIIALKEGKVELVSNEKDATGKPRPIVTMVPGEVVQLKHEPGLPIVKKITEPAVIAEWTQNEFHFDFTPLPEIGKIIENTYGYSFEIQDPVLMERTMNGHLQAANVNEFIQALEVTLHLKIEKKNKRLLVYPWQTAH